MSVKPKDPLLAIAKGVVYFMLGAIAFVGVMVAIGAVATLLFGNNVTEYAVADTELPGYFRWIITLLLVMVVGALYLGFRFFLHLLRIVKSVGEGDPFVPANADRLTAMAWLMLAINLIGIPLSAIGYWIAGFLGEDKVRTDGGIDFGGLLLILTLFILARVFRHGTRLREDLEGTV